MLRESPQIYWEFGAFSVMMPVLSRNFIVNCLS